MNDSLSDKKLSGLKSRRARNSDNQTLGQIAEDFVGPGEINSLDESSPQLGIRDSLDVRLESLFLRELTRFEVNPSKKSIASGLFYRALGALNEVRGEVEVALYYYRKSLDALLEVPRPIRREVRSSFELLEELLETKGEQREAKRIKRRIELKYLANRTDRVSQYSLCEIAFELYTEGNYDEAEKLYERLIENGFQLASIYCNVARLMMVTGRHDCAKEAMRKAQCNLDDSETYLLPRILFFRLLFDLLAGKEIAPVLLELENALSVSGACLNWSIEELLATMEPHVSKDEFSLLLVLGAVLNDRQNFPALRENSLWISANKQTL